MTLAGLQVTFDPYNVTFNIITVVKKLYFATTSYGWLNKIQT